MSQSQVLLSPFQLASATDGVVLASSEDSDFRSPLALRFLDGRDELEMDFVVVVVVVTEVVVVGSSSSASNRTVFFSCLLLLLLLLPPAIVDLEADVGILVELMQATPLLLLILRLRLWWR
jgi:hypothetical protein